jgi:NAD(P)-dependent dehydrogenase (short-subunit alcohol dehydrogenase family)
VVVDTTISTYGSLTTVVNNAAPTELLRRPADVAEVSLEDWDAVLRVTLTGAMLMSKHAIPHLIAAGGGTIINISSDSGARAAAGLSAYCAAKAGLNALTRSIALEYAPVNIRSNSIQVGQILPPQSVDLISSHPVLGPKLLAAHPLRLGRREDIAGAVVFLASDEASFVNGTTIPVDGGASSVTNLLSGELFSI